MKFIRKAALVLLALILVFCVWIWWNRPRKVDMTSYVPADSLIYIEANDLPDIASGLVSTDAWKALAPAAGIRSDLGHLGWLGRLASWTGIGSADAVVFSRAQLAVAVLGFDASGAGDALKIRPRYAVVAETHTGESRTRSAIEGRVGDFARRAYGDPQIEAKEVDGVKLTTWTSADGERRIVAAVTGSVAIVGNDVAAVQACLAVQRKDRPSLKGNPQVEEMRRRVGGTDALAFGYASAEGAARLLELKAITYAGQISADPRAQSAAASLLPALARKILGRVGWSTRLSNGMIEDRYYLALQAGVADRLKSVMSPAGKSGFGAFELLPRDTQSTSRYSYLDPAGAWRGLNNTVTSQFDTLGSILIGRLLKAWLSHYGIEDPDTFMQAIGSELVTANLDEQEGSAVTVVELRDEQTLRGFVAKRLGAKPRSELVGDAEMLVSNNDKHDAASFVGRHLLLGKVEAVRRCLEARVNGQTLGTSDSFRKSQASLGGTSSLVVQFYDDKSPASSFVKAIAAQKAVSERSLNEAKLNEALGELRYAFSETQLVDGGFERMTRSSFGQFGLLATQFTPPDN